MTSHSCQHIQNVKLLSVHVLCVSNIKCPISQYSCPSFRYLDLQVTMSALSTRISLFNWHFLHIIPTLFVFLVTHLSKSSTNTILGLRFCLFFPGGFRSYSGLSASLSVFSPNPSYGSSRYPCVHHCPSTVVSALLPCHMS